MDVLIAAGALLGAAACSWAITASSLGFFTGLLLSLALSLLTSIFVSFRIASPVVAVSRILSLLWRAIEHTCIPRWPVIVTGALVLLIATIYILEVCVSRPPVACLC